MLYGLRHQLEGTAPAEPRSGKSWLRRLYLVELGVLVSGILIAFSLESWWTRRGEAREQRANLTSLREDFRQNRDRLDSVALMLGRVQLAGAQLLRIVQGEQSRPSPDSLSSLVASAFRLAGFQPVTSAYDNLINAQDLRLVEDRALRLSLAAFISQVNWIKEVERWQNDQWVFVNQLFINQWIEVSDLAAYWVDADARAALPRTRFTTQWDAVIRNQTFRNIVMQRVIAAADVLRTQQVLKHQIDHILKLLDRALERRS